MTRLRIPTGPEEMTADWLTHALRQGAALREARVADFDVETISEGVGLIGQVLRLRPRYDRPEEGAPASLVAKFPAAVPENREIGRLFRFYEREVRFYQELAGRVGIATPRPYYAAMDLERGDYVLLLEDLAPGRRLGDQVSSCSLAEAELAVGEAARLHAIWWQHPDLARLDWMPYVNDPVNKAAQQQFWQSWEPFLQRFADRLPAWLPEAGRKLGENIEAILDDFAQEPHTIIHGDYRLDNMFFGEEGGRPTLAVIDWQITCRGRATFDVAYFTCTSLDVGLRRRHGLDLLRLYHRTLVEGGVQGYSFEQCLHEFRVGAFFCLVYAVIAGGSLDWANERGAALATAMVERTVSAIAELEAADAI
jgi:hypothetical protein